MSEGTFGNPKVVEEELDILLIGGGMACCGAAYEIMRWAEAAKAGFFTASGGFRGGKPGELIRCH